MNNEFKVIANITVPVDDVTEQAFREGYKQGKSEDSRIIDIINHYGLEQMKIMLEEMLELGLAIMKLERGYSAERLYNLKEEVADVLIMARQLRIALGAAEIDNIIDEKLERQLGRIRGGEGRINNGQTDRK